MGNPVERAVRRMGVNVIHLAEDVGSGALFRELKTWGRYAVSHLEWDRAPSRTLALRNGFTFEISPSGTHKWAVHDVILHDDYRLRRLALTGGTVVDLGANIGLFSLYAAARFPAVRVVAVEPEPENFSRLQGHVARNDLAGRVSAVQALVADRIGEGTLHVDPWNAGMHTMGEGPGPGVTVRCVTLEWLWKEYGITDCPLLKMDVEGAEYDIVRAAPVELLRRIERLHMEYHDDPRDPSRRGIALEASLRAAGFEVERRPVPFKPFGYLYCRRP